jgi:ribosomal protein S27AE
MPAVATKMICPKCGALMNHHCDKLVYTGETSATEPGGIIAEFHSCPECGSGATRPA